MNLKFKLTIPIILFATLVTALISVSASAKGEKVEIHITDPQVMEVTLAPNQDIVLWTGWAACSEGLTNDWIENSQIHLSLVKDAQVLWEVIPSEARQYWSTPEFYLELGGGACMWPVETMWISYWRYEDLKIKDSGDYQLQLRITVSLPTVDGGDWDEDGVLDYWDGVFREQTILVHVTKK